MMSEQVTTVLTQYGYLAIFALIFLQEVGVPSPIPNEFVLLFSGYLSFTGVLNAVLVLLSAILADLMASFILFELFYFFGKTVMNRKPKWLPVPVGRLERLKQKMLNSGQAGTYIGRLTPFIKGYVSVLCGLLRVPQKKYGIVLITTSIIWSAVYVGGGYLAGPYFYEMVQRNNTILFILPIVLVVSVLFVQLLKKKSTV